MSIPIWWITVIGSVAAVCTTVAFVPQLVRVWRLRRAEEISSATFVLFSVGTFVWLVYGILLTAWPIILANAITLGLALGILLLKVVWERTTPAPTP
jgi:MtN3 and saliva related transmembrane protein